MAVALQISQNHSCNTLPYYHSLIPCASAKFANALSVAQATIVLIDFTRSWSDDRGAFSTTALLNKPLIKECEADRKAGRVYGGNDGLAFAMCEARKRRKEPAGRVEAFFCLDLLVTFLSREK
jgi:hypothetical protein